MYDVFLQGYLSKEAELPEDYTGLSHQQYLPIAKRRVLTPAEQQEVEQAQTKWLRGPFASEGSPISSKMASPGKRAALLAIMATLAGAGTGAALTQRSPIGMGTGAAVGALAGIPAGVLGYLSAKQHNETLEERMRRLPEGATLRDMRADPLYQKERDRSTNNANMAALAAALARR